MGLEPDRFEECAERHFAGLSRVMPMADPGPQMAGLWYEFSADGAVPGQVGKVAYGLMPKEEPGEGLFRYFAAVETAAPDGVPSRFERLSVPPSRFAVFPYAGPMDEVKSLWQGIFGEWLPASGLQQTDAPFIEVYGPNFDRETGEGGLEIWIPVSEKA